MNLDGAGFDPDGDEVAFHWTLVERPSGSTAVIAKPSAARTTFKADKLGKYRLQLMVDDGRGLSATDEVTVEAGISVVSSTIVNGQLPARSASTAMPGGSNTSPALRISSVPDGTEHFAIIMDDETSPCGTGTGACKHWAVFNLPATKVSLAEGEVLTGAVLGHAQNGQAAYFGPEPPNGKQHTYKITVYALDKDMPTIVSTSTLAHTRASFEAQYASYIISQYTITATYP